MTDMAQELHKGPMTKALAEEAAMKILGVESSVQAVMIIDSLGKVLAHARSEGFDIETEGSVDVQPRLLTFPDQEVSVFVKVTPALEDYDRLYKAILGTLKGYES